MQPTRCVLNTMIAPTGSARYAYHPQLFITTPPNPIKLGHIRLHHAIIKRGHKM